MCYFEVVVVVCVWVLVDKVLFDIFVDVVVGME